MSFLDELIFEENGLVGRNSDQDIILFDKGKIQGSQVNGNELQIQFTEEETRHGLQLLEARFVFLSSQGDSNA